MLWPVACCISQVASNGVPLRSKNEDDALPMGFRHAAGLFLLGNLEQKDSICP